MFAATENSDGLRDEGHVDGLAILVLTARNNPQTSIDVQIRPFHAHYVLFSRSGPDTHFQDIGGGGARDPQLLKSVEEGRDFIPMQEPFSLRFLEFRDTLARVVTIKFDLGRLVEHRRYQGQQSVRLIGGFLAYICVQPFHVGRGDLVKGLGCPR